MSTDRRRRRFEEALGVPFTRGNRVERLRNGREIFPAMLDAIRTAERSVEFETFVYWHGEIAHEFADALAESAARGVEVRILLDAAGSQPMPDEVRSRIEESEAEVHDFGPLNPVRFWEIDHRTHRKLLICDGDVAFTGGVGIAEEWEGDARNPGEWRDSHFRLRGPVVPALRGTFIQHWLATVDEPGGLPLELPPPSDRPYGGRGPGPDRSDGPGSAEAQVVRSTAAGRWTDIQTLFRTLFLSAEQQLRITTAYFVPDEDLVDALCGVAGRGVEVEIMHPGPHIDHRVSQLAGEAVYDRLLEAGVKIWRYQPTMLHAKVVTADGILSCVGSANFNFRSLQKDDEASVVILDEELASLLDRDFDEDRERCEAVTDPGEWNDRSWLRKTAQSAARLVRGEL